MIVVVLLWMVLPLPVGLLIGGAFRWSREGAVVTPLEAERTALRTLAEAA